MSKRSKFMSITSEERLLASLYEVVKRKSEKSRDAMGLISWYMANKMWTEKQKYFARSIINNESMKEKLRKKSQSNKKHYLYAISNGEQVKLGFSCNIEKRLKTLQTSSPCKLEEIWRFYVGKGPTTARSAERKLHRFCKKHHISGEWYSCDVAELVKTFSL